MPKPDIVEALQELEGQKKPPLTEILRPHFEQIQNLKRGGVAYKTIHARLEGSIETVSLAQFYSAVEKLKREEGLGGGARRLGEKPARKKAPTFKASGKTNADI